MSTASLLKQLPADGADTTAILENFVNWASSKGLELYPAQEEAILELLDGKHVILSTPTGSGKSLVAQALHFQAMAEGKKSFYTCPIKALVNEKFFALCDAFGPENVGMMTGDASINKEAPIICCTAEILSNLALRDPGARIDCVVMDEFHYYGDKDRGIAWQVPLLILPKTTFLLMSATLGDTTRIEQGLEEVTGRKVAVIRGAERPVPLEFDYSEVPLHETIEKLVEKDRHPIYLVNFSQKAAAEQAQNLMSVNFSSKEEKAKIAQALEGTRFDTPYGKELQRFLRHGIGLHHAGLLPKYRLLVEKLAQAGLLKVISGTDTLGVGVNIPLRTVLFTQLCKYDGERVGVLTVRDFLQVAGRAGRKGFDDRGYVVVQAPEHVIENIKIAEKQAANPKKKVQKKPAPTKGYAHWDKQTFERMFSKPPEALESRFDVTHSLLLTLMQADGRGDVGYPRLLTMIQRAHVHDAAKKRFKRLAAARFRQLRKAGLVALTEWHGRKGRAVEVDPSLQEDFSIHHTLSLYLLETLARLDKESESYALDVLTLVESILENPWTILYKQLDKAKGEKVAELKAQGMDYEDRMAELEKVEYPKPLREFVYETFNAFADKHPWVGEENIRPKSIARELYESLSSFDNYVRDYGLQRSEGVLLRYLTDAYKTLTQTVPEAYHDERVDEVVAFLRTTLRGVDSSLLDEWESLRRPGQKVEIAGVEEKPYDLAEDARGLRLRARVELHRLLKAASLRDWESALAALQPGHEWTAEKLEAELAPFFEEFRAIDTTPFARQAHFTRLEQKEPRLWEAQQRLVAPQAAAAALGDEEDEERGATEWALFCTIDLRGPYDDTQPLLTLQRIGA
ncbi:DEAD/DEAH box helicase [Vulgatibacter sp.]|uniref:DEAD/DEAH box helicase n=1 Tax=Vulgatibacter sp. TaxID=1971226 RepID=UPI0035628B09